MFGMTLKFEFVEMIESKINFKNEKRREEKRREEKRREEKRREEERRGEKRREEKRRKRKIKTIKFVDTSELSLWINNQKVLKFVEESRRKEGGREGRETRWKEGEG